MITVVNVKPAEDFKVIAKEASELRLAYEQVKRMLTRAVAASESRFLGRLQIVFNSIIGH